MLAFKILIKIDIDFDYIFLGEKSYRNILIYDISYKTFMDEKPSGFKFENVDGFIQVYDGTRHLMLFIPERYDAIYDRAIYLISKKCNITCTLLIIILH